MVHSGNSDIDLISAIDGFKRLFNSKLGISNRVADGAASYYIILICSFPTTFNAISKRATELAPGFQKADLVNGKKELLKKGIIAEILPTMDQDNPTFRNKFKRETIFPVSPRALWDVYSKTDTDQEIYADVVGQIYRDCYIKNFDFENMMNRIHICQQNTDHGSSDCLTMYFSSMWVIYSLLENAKKTKTLSMMLSGDKATLSPNVNFYEMLINQGVTIRAILDERYIYKGIGIHFQLPQAEVKYNVTDNQGTRRITIADNLFALDGRKLLPFKRPDPSYIGTLYFDRDNVSQMKKIFDNTWNSLPI